jgi:hypothetical protein
VVDNEGDAERRKALLDVIYEEMMERVGDREKDTVMQWWLDKASHWRVVSSSPFEMDRGHNEVVHDGVST